MLYLAELTSPDISIQVERTHLLVHLWLTKGDWFSANSLLLFMGAEGSI